MGPRAATGVTRDRVYRFVRECLAFGLPPTVREVQAAMGFRAVQTAREHLERLVAEGRLGKHAGKARGYYLADDDGGRPAGGSSHLSGAGAIMVPVLGRVQAGGLAVAIEDPEGHVPARSRGGEKLFGLRVRGESMVGAGILPDDIVIVRAQPSADSGAIVVALVDDAATVKRLRLRRGRIELHPENSDFDVIIPPPDDCRILGIVIEVRRLLDEKRGKG